MSKSKRTSKAKRHRSTGRGLTREQILRAAAASAAVIDERLSKRSHETAKIDTAIPASTLAFLQNLYHEPPITVPRGMAFDDEWSFVGKILTALRDAYRQGCREGYIEGFVARRRPHKQGSATGNAGKRKTLVELPDGRKMTRDERDTLMVAEYESLLALQLKKTPAMQRLAGKYGFESWQGVDKVINKFRNRSASNSRTAST